MTKYSYRVERISDDWSHDGMVGTLRESTSRAVQALADNTGVMTRKHMNEVFSRLLNSKGGTEKLNDYMITVSEVKADEIDRLFGVDVPCPHCLQPEGKVCRDHYGRRAKLHARRLRASNAKNEN